MKRDSKPTVYILLGVLWVVFALWQFAEHQRASGVANGRLELRARDISASVEAVIRSGRRFGVTSERRVNAALEELTRSGALISVALLNEVGAVVASGGTTITIDLANIKTGTIERTADRLMLVDLVDVGDVGTTTVLLGSRFPMSSPGPTSEDRPTSGSVRRGPGSPTPVGGEDIHRDRRGGGQNGRRSEGGDPGQRERPGGDMRRPPDEDRGGSFGPRGPGGGGDSRGESDPRAAAFMRFSDEGGFRRPPWMTEEHYRLLLQQQALHKFVLIMSAQEANEEIARDFWLRFALSCIALVAALGMSVAWRGMERARDLQIRLIRASEMNTYLEEMNVAAAGLAHETRNPLNIVRGLGQMIARDASTSPQVKVKVGELIEEVDRVTTRLNEFINYSKPRAAKLAPVNLEPLLNDVERALESDREDKNITFTFQGEDIPILADEALLRQVFFNLLLNACQAVEEGGKITVECRLAKPGSAIIEVHDDGCGVPEASRVEIFSPYVTLSDKGTGLGLAVVSQIMLAHHWEIAYVAREAGGSTFRISGVQVARKVA